MEEAFTYICAHAHNAYWVIFLLLLLTGINIPLSEDLLILSAGALASQCIHEHAFRLLLFAYFGAIFSAWIAYWIGRKGGPKLYQVKLFRKILNPSRVDRLKGYYNKYGIFTFIVGRFCPGGIRNGLFMTSGLTKMSFPLFIMRDGFACLISTVIIYSIGFHFGKNFHILFHYFKGYEHFLLFTFIALIAIVLFWIQMRKKG
jgi:membrane-associated protein